jgi:hypothetical protein
LQRDARVCAVFGLIAAAMAMVTIAIAAARPERA